MIIAAEMGAPLRLTSGPAITHAGDLAAILSGMNEGDVLFVDEIHRMSRPAEEMLYMAMEDFRVDVVIGKGPGRHRDPAGDPAVHPGRRHHPGRPAARARCATGSASPRHLEFYEPHELDRIVHRSAGLLGVELTADGAAEIASRSRGTPADRQPAAAPGARLRPGPRRRRRHARRSPGPPSTSTRSTSSASTGSTGPCSTPCAAASAGDRSASPRWRSPSARSARPSRRSPSRSWSATASWPGRRAAGSRRRRRGSTSGLVAPPSAPPLGGEPPERHAPLRGLTATRGHTRGYTCPSAGPCVAADIHSSTLERSLRASARPAACRSSASRCSSGCCSSGPPSRRQKELARMQSSLKAG